jgi:UDP-N-acetylmuramoyl-L-alanyl-D-glutamate--2,6-diaminopimelate ligase
VHLREIARLPAIAASRIASPELDLRALSADSRRVDHATAFFARKGGRVDGHAFLQEALGAGAPALFLTDPERYADWAAAPAERLEGLAGLFLARDVPHALAELAAAIYGEPARRMRLLAVTGTNGKTTVTYLAAQMLRAMGEPCAIVGSVGMLLDGEPERLGLTTPEAPELQAFLARCLGEGVSAAAMEASSIGIDRGRTHALAFRAAAFTNLSQDHLDVHGDMESYREAKFRLFTGHEVARAIVNLDDPAGRELAARLEERDSRPALLSFALDRPADLGAQHPRWDAAGVETALRVRGRLYPVRAPLLGRYNLSNLLAAAGLLIASGSTPEAVARAAADTRGAPGRLERVPVPHPFTVLVDYAHTPDALENVLGAVRPLTPGTLWVVFGCGGERDRGKRPRMGAVAERLADRVVLTSDNPRGEPAAAILDAIVRGLRDPRAAARIESREEAIRWTLDRAQPGDLVLIAGKGHETDQEIAGRRLPFSDQAVVRAWSEER